MEFHNIKPKFMDIVNHKAEESWKYEIEAVPKLLTYSTFKGEYQVDPYDSDFMNRNQSSLFALFKTGIFYLRIETGSYQNIPAEYMKNEVNFYISL